jgi:hypothetical protein
MSASDEAYDKFITDFTPPEHGSYLGRQAALRAGAELIQKLAADQNTLKTPAVAAAEIAAIGAMVGHYIGALVEVEFNPYTSLELKGVYGSRFPTTLKVVLEQPPNSSPTE